MKRTIFKDALNRADIGIIEFRQILYLVQTVNNLTHCGTVRAGNAVTV